MRLISSSLAAMALLVGVAASQPAAAQCYWTGYGYQCAAPYKYRPYNRGYYRPYYRSYNRPYYRGYSRGYYRPYGYRHW